MTEGILGLDTSCYTSSVAVVSPQGALLHSERRLLVVRGGGRGLRQSEALFQHVQNLPALLEGVRDALPSLRLLAVCASSKPRDRQDSYMPVFTAGEGLARSLAAGLNLPAFYTSHQQGHLAAAALGAGALGERFLAMHISGGTTELLLVEGERIERLGGDEDLHAGQFVDRVGVRMGCSFPAGPQLEGLAEGFSAKGLLGASARGLNCSFSGPEAAAQRLLDQGQEPGQVAAEVYACLERSAFKLLEAGVRATGATRALLFGGVASSARFRRELLLRAQRLGLPLALHFGRPELSGDNAVGVARIGARLYAMNQRQEEDK